LFFFYFCTVYGGSEDTVDHGEVEDNAARRDALAGPLMSVEHRNVSCLRLQEESAKKKQKEKVREINVQKI
jgi:hypothetical protein